MNEREPASPEATHNLEGALAAIAPTRGAPKKAGAWSHYSGVYGSAQSWRYLVAMAFLSFLGCRKPPAGDFATGDVVVVNAMGVGQIDERGTNGGEAGYIVTFRWRSEKAFIPDAKAKSLLHRPVSEVEGRAMLGLITETGTANVEADPKAWFRAMARLWAQADHRAQADYWGQVLRRVEQTPDLRKSVTTLSIGNHHLVEEIALVLGRVPADVEADIEKRYPWLRELLQR